MNKLEAFCEERKLNKEDVFEIAVGQDNPILPGGNWCPYFVIVGEESITCHKANGDRYIKEIPYSAFEEAEFGVGSARLWLQCSIEGAFVPFSANRKNWKSPAAQKMLKKLGGKISKEDQKMYKNATGALWVFYIAMKT